MNKRTFTALMFGCGLLVAPACERENEVEDELADLHEARQRTDQVAGELQQELEVAKRDVERLEEKLELARRGVTDEVIEERGELKEALAQQEQQVKAEIRQAQQEAAQHNTATEKVRSTLQETVPAQVDTQVSTQTQVVPGQTDIQSETRTATIQVENMNVEEEGEAQVDESRHAMR